MISIETWAYDFSAVNEDGLTIYYKITSETSPKTVSVTYQTNTNTRTYTSNIINIPNSVTYNGNSYGVTGIDDTAFRSCDAKFITLPKFLISIGKSAFAYCGNLTSITIPSSVTSIGAGAFSSCM